jgi:hypothetical protein
MQENQPVLPEIQAAVEQPKYESATSTSGLISSAVSASSIAVLPEIVSASQVISQTVSVPEVSAAASLPKITVQRNDKPLVIPHLLAARFGDLDDADLYAATRTFRVDELLAHPWRKDSVERALNESAKGVHEQTSPAFVKNTKTHAIALQELVGEYQEYSVVDEADSQQLSVKHSRKPHEFNQTIVDEFHAKLVELS